MGPKEMELTSLRYLGHIPNTTARYPPGTASHTPCRILPSSADSPATYITEKDRSESETSHRGHEKQEKKWVNSLSPSRPIVLAAARPGQGTALALAGGVGPTAETKHGLKSLAVGAPFHQRDFRLALACVRVDDDVVLRILVLVEVDGDPRGRVRDLVAGVVIGKGGSQHVGCCWILG